MLPDQWRQVGQQAVVRVSSVPQSWHHHLAFRVLVEAAYPDVTDALTVQGVLLNPICQEELYNPGRDVSTNSNKNSILTLQRPVPDVSLGYASTGQITGTSPRVRGKRSLRAIWRRNSPASSTS